MHRYLGVLAANAKVRAEVVPKKPIKNGVRFSTFSSSKMLARTTTESGVRAYVASVDLSKLPVSFVGRVLDHSFLADLPTNVDPCGENGEFHAFVSKGPMLSREIPVVVGETVVRDGFAYSMNRIIRACTLDVQHAGAILFL
jgi:diphthamide synthase (EF-2-diphthine--ammonia ligase)